MGVGAALGVLGAAAVLWFLFRKYKSKHTSGTKGMEIREGSRPMSRTVLDGNIVYETGSGLPPQIAGNAINGGDGSEIHEMGSGQKNR